LNLSIARVLFALSEKMWLNGELPIFSEILVAVTYISSLIELILRVFLMVRLETYHRLSVIILSVVDCMASSFDDDV